MADLNVEVPWDECVKIALKLRRPELAEWVLYRRQLEMQSRRAQLHVLGPEDTDD
jgi:hypothetical protein